MLPSPNARHDRGVHWIERDGQLLPRRISGDPALDFCNTRAGWDGALLPRGEWLRDYDAFVGWAAYAELLDAAEESALRGRTGARADAVLDEARRLRSSIRSAALDPTDAGALVEVAEVVRRSAGRLTLDPGPRPTWRVGGGAVLALPLLRVAWAAGELVTSGDLYRVKACPGEDCGWLFMDRSGRRRWCSMSSCGNRAKVRAHAARQR
jgi:predicted RNA-binding Zn ribbon-like protein